MRADLVRPARQQLDFRKTVLPVGIENFVLGADFLGAVRRAAEYRHLVLTLVFRDVARQDAAVLLRLAVHQTEVVFFQLAGFHFEVEDPQAFGVFRGDDDAARVAVDAVDKGRRKSLLRFGVIFALVIEVVLHPRDERIKVIALVGMDDHPGLFVEQQNIFVLIDDLELRRRLEELVVLFLALLKELVFDIEGQHVALLQHDVDIALFAVALDALLADVHVHHRLRHGFEALLQKFIQTLTRVVFSDFQCSHSYHRFYHTVFFNKLQAHNGFPCVK